MCIFKKKKSQSGKINSPPYISLRPTKKKASLGFICVAAVGNSKTAVLVKRWFIEMGLGRICEYEFIDFVRFASCLNCGLPSSHPTGMEPKSMYVHKEKRKPIREKTPPRYVSLDQRGKSQFGFYMWAAGREIDNRCFVIKWDTRRDI